MIRLAGFIAILAAPVWAGVVDARYTGETTRYDHGVFGESIEYGTLEIETLNGVVRIVLPENRVFEDIAPRVADMDGDGDNEVVVVETDVNLGAQLAIYDENGKVAETPFIGRTHRWLAPAGIGDFDGDGMNDVAYVETPHLGKRLMFWSLKGGNLVLIAEAQGLTNHRFGEAGISGGVRNCGGVVEVITASGDWRYIVATRLVNGLPEFTTLGEFNGAGSFADAMACR